MHFPIATPAARVSHSTRGGLPSPSVEILTVIFWVCLGIIILRKQQPDIERPFKTPFVPLVPILGILTCVLMMVFLPFDT
jgi:APA family basic amino acid/polyamine antiporter